MTALRRPLLRLALVAALALLAGCLPPPGAFAIPKIEVRVNATAPEALKKGTSFRIAGKNGEHREADLHFGEAASLVTTALSARGLYEAPRANRADVFIELEYGMGPPRAATGARTRTAGGNLEKFLILTAREGAPAIAADREPKLLWTVQLSVVDESDDLRKYLALLATAAIDQVGVDSGGQKIVYISDNDRAVGFVRKGL